MKDLTFLAPGKIVSKIGSADSINDYIDDGSVQRVLVVTDKGILDAGLLNGCIQNLQSAGKVVDVFSGVSADPAEKTIHEAVSAARKVDADLVIGLGGGSSMDVAKVVSVLAEPSCTLVLEDLYGVDAFHSTRLPLILIPTTAGTGSEVTPISIITTGETTKAGIVSRHLLPDIALLDAQLTVGLPSHVTAATGIDAMVHAIEAYTGKLKKNPLSDMYALEALKQLSRNIELVVKNGSDLKARQNMLLGSLLAGQAFANSPVGAVHALAYPLGGHFHIPHGLSNALVLTEVMKFNVSECAELYSQLAPIIMGEAPQGLDTVEVSFRLIKWLEVLIQSLSLPSSLRDCGVTKESLPTLAEDAMKQQRLLINNPREMTYESALEIYSKVF